MSGKHIAALGLGLLAAQAFAGDAPTFQSDMDKVSYGIGVDVARNLRKQEVGVNAELLVRGVHDGLAGEKLAVPEKELRKLVKNFQAEVRRNMMLNHKSAAEANKKKGDAFLAENRAREGVVALASGVQYRVLREGAGRRPADTDKVECHYRGTLLDGTEFDATEPGRPAMLAVSQVIAGWKEALKLMAEGSKWQIVIPPQSAYGERGVGADIGPNETLVFEVELLAVK